MPIAEKQMGGFVFFCRKNQISIFVALFVALFITIFITIFEFLGLRDVKFQQLLQYKRETAAAIILSYIPLYKRAEMTEIKKIYGF